MTEHRQSPHQHRHWQFWMALRSMTHETISFVPSRNQQRLALFDVRCANERQNGHAKRKKIDATNLSLITWMTPVTDGDITLVIGFPIGCTVPRIIAYGTLCSPFDDTWSFSLASRDNSGADCNYEKYTLSNFTCLQLFLAINVEYLQGIQCVFVIIVAFQTQSKY